MGDERTIPPKQLARMTPDQLTARIERNLRENDALIEQLALRADLQAYAEQAENELITLLEEASTFLKTLSPLSAEMASKRDALLAKMQRKL